MPHDQAIGFKYTIERLRVNVAEVVSLLEILPDEGTIYRIVMDRERGSSENLKVRVIRRFKEVKFVE